MEMHTSAHRPPNEQLVRRVSTRRRQAPATVGNGKPRPDRRPRRSTTREPRPARRLPGRLRRQLGSDRRGGTSTSRNNVSKDGVSKSRRVGHRLGSTVAGRVGPARPRHVVAIRPAPL